MTERQNRFEYSLLGRISIAETARFGYSVGLREWLLEMTAIGGVQVSASWQSERDHQGHAALLLLHLLPS